MNEFDNQDIDNQEESSVFPEAPEGESPTPAKKLTPEEQMKKIKREVEERLYQNDPVIREGIDAQRAVEEARGKPAPKESPFLYDEYGNFIGVKPEHKHRVKPQDVMREIRKSTERKLGGNQ